MALRRLARCSSLFVIIFLMCPKRSRLNALMGKKQEYVPAVRRTRNDVNDANNIKFLPAQWSTNIMRYRDDADIMGADEEPGFDITDDEIIKFKLWPKGVIPYYIDVPSFNDKVLRDRIRLFLNDVNSVTKISFQEMPSPPKDDKTRWVFFANRRGQLGCGDHSIMNFTNEGVQHVLLGYDCMATGGELAEAVLAIAGVPPQHNAPDRDDYIQIIHENIIPEKRYLFQKLNNDQWLFHEIKYDFASGGHYDYHKYSLNGRATIDTQPEYSGTSMGETNGFTSSDIKKLRMLYNYIVKKKDDSVPECDKLFKKGKNFNKILSESSNLKPRKKPNRYLGLPDKEHIDEQDDNSNDKPQNDAKSYGDNDSSDVPVTSKSNLKNRHTKFKKKIDPLSYLSDYQTDKRKYENKK